MMEIQKKPDVERYNSKNNDQHWSRFKMLKMLYLTLVNDIFNKYLNVF